MQPEYHKSIEFLQRFRPSGQWVLTAVSLDKTSITTGTFYGPEDCLRWLEAQGATKNIYFHVNSVVRDLNRKANKTEIKSMDWLHVDVDPRAGEDLNEERERALKILEEPPKGLPRPTLIIFSGGGYQGFWKLKNPIDINGQENNWTEAERYNKQIELIMDGDNCHDVSRIMRLPGTLNRPDAKKKAKGRTTVLARVHYFSEAEYDISDFTKAPDVQQLDAKGFGSRSNIVNVTSGVNRVDDIMSLNLKNACMVTIVQGSDPDDPARFESRSEALFWVCCEMVRSGVDDDTIYSVITDPRFQISESVVEKGNGAHKYAIRQIMRAKEEAIDPHLRAMNEKHAVIMDIGGKCRVMTQTYDHELDRDSISIQTFEDIRNSYLNIKVKVGENPKTGVPLFKPLGKWWLEHTNRLQYDAIAYAPGKNLKNAYNLWQGFSCNAIPGDCSLFLTHVLENVCGSNMDYYNYLVNWMAKAVQRPHVPGYVALVMRGKQGTGKSFFAKMFGSLFGRHFLQVSDPKHLVGSFNAHLRDCSVLFADEAFYAGDKKHESILKTLITEETIAIEQKGIDMKISGNYIHLILASNSDWVIPAGREERRFFVLDVLDEKMQDAEYFYQIAQQMNNGGREALLHYLLNVDISEFIVTKVPKTKALQEQKAFSMPIEQEWWYNKLLNGSLLDKHDDWESMVAVEELMVDYLRYAQRVGGYRRASTTQLSMYLKKFTHGKIGKIQRRVRVTINDLNGGERTLERPYYWKMPNLRFCRDVFDHHFGGPYYWDDFIDEDHDPERDLKESGEI